MADDTPEALQPIQLSSVKQRLLNSSTDIGTNPDSHITYQHTVLCQTGLPYKSLGNQRVWDKRQGNAVLRISAGEAYHPKTQEFVKLALPYGTKPRLILMHFNAEAIRTQDPEIEVEDSMTAFMKRVLRLDPNGKEIRRMKDQLACISASTIRMATALSDERAVQVNTQIVTAFDLWFPKDARQRVLWPSTVRLSNDYFDSLAKHAVPLDERAIAALAHSSIALDIYSWLSQRLHRIPLHKPQFITWKAIKEQFGSNYGQMNYFRRDFKNALNQVYTQYRAARLDMDGKGMTLYHSPPPIKGRIFAIKSSS